MKNTLLFLLLAFGLNAFGQNTYKNINKSTSPYGVNSFGNMYIGDSTLTALITWVFYGSSLTASPGPCSTIGWVAQVATERQFIPVDSAIPGTGISPNCPVNPSLAMIHRIPGFPVHTAGGKFLFDAGVNDVYSDSVAYALALGQILDTLTMNRGWAASDIYVISSFRASTFTDTQLLKVNIKVCAPRGVNIIDVLHPLYYHYHYLGQNTNCPDSTHPTTLGMLIAENVITNSLPFGSFKGNLTTTGNTFHAGTLRVNGTDSLMGKTYPVGGISQSVANGKIMKYIVQVAGTDYGEEDYVFGNVGVPDTIVTREAGNSGNGSLYQIVHRKTTGIDTLFQAGGNNANITLGGGNPNTAYRLNVNGQSILNGFTNINGGFNVIGDNTYRQFQYTFFNNGSGTVEYMGDVGNEIQMGNSYGRWDWGTYNGTSFTANSGFNAGGTKFYVNRVTDDGTGGFLEVNGLFSTVGIVNTAGVITGVTTKSGTTQTLDGTAEIWVFNGTSATTWTLPALSGNTGRHYQIKNIGSATISLVPAGTDHIFDVSSVTSLSITTGSYIEVYNNGTFWVVSNGGGGGGGGFTNPMSAAGQMIYGSTAGVATATATPGHAGMHLVWDGTAWSPVDSTASGASLTTAAINATSTANGVDITAGVLTLHAADATNGGVVTNGTQTFAGAKTFLGGTILGFSTNQVYIRGTGGIHVGDNSTQNLDLNAGASTGTGLISMRTGVQWNSSDITIHGQMDLDGAIYFNSTSSTTGGILQASGGDVFLTANSSTGGHIWRTNAGATTLMKLVGATGNLLLGTTTDVPTSMINLTSTTKGSIPFPIMTLAQFTAISSKATGLHVILSDSSNKLAEYNSAKIVTYATTDQLPANSTVFSQTADLTISNSTSNLTTLGTGVGSNVIAANTLVSGKSITITGSGVISTTSVLPTVAFTFSNTSSTVTNAGINGITTSMTNVPIQWEYRGVVRGTGSGANIALFGWVDVNGTKTYTPFGSTYAFDTTIGQTFDVKLQFGTANVGDTFTSNINLMRNQ